MASNYRDLRPKKATTGQKYLYFELTPWIKLRVFFLFTSVIPLKLDKNRDLTLLHFRCVYEDKYIVSYNEGITPVKRYFVAPSSNKYLIREIQRNLKR